MSEIFNAAQKTNLLNSYKTLSDMKKSLLKLTILSVFVFISSFTFVQGRDLVIAETTVPSVYTITAADKIAVTNVNEVIAEIRNYLDKNL